MAEPPPVAGERSYLTHIAVLLAAAAVTIAVLGARASDLAGAAGGSWEKAVRIQVKPSALRTENLLYVYGDPVTTVMQYLTARIRADEYRRALAADGLTQRERRTLSALTVAEQSAATSLHAAAAAQSGWFEGRPDESFDLAGRLASEQQATAMRASPQDVRTAGDARSKHAVLEALAVVPAALAFLLGSAAQARPQMAKRLLVAGALVLSASLVMAVALEAVPLR